jgi:hypothetical protein
MFQRAAKQRPRVLSKMRASRGLSLRSAAPIQLGIIFGRIAAFGVCFGIEPSTGHVVDVLLAGVGSEIAFDGVGWRTGSGVLRQGAHTSQRVCSRCAEQDGKSQECNDPKALYHGLDY